MQFLHFSYKLLIVISLLIMPIGEKFFVPQAIAKETKEVSLATQYQVHLPYIRNVNNSIFGAYLNPVDNSNGLYKLSTASMNWTRIDLSWQLIEPEYGKIDWAMAVNFDTMVSNAINAGLKPIVIIGDTPSWAIKPGFSCGPIRQEYFPEFARFISQTIQRYSFHPYNILHYEIYNEPDAPGFLGCWGDPGDTTYFGGSYYGQMLQSVYPFIKVVNPQSQILFGGLLLDCDPNNPPDIPNEPGKKKDCTPGKFFEGALASGATDAFDGVSFHSYDYYTSLGNYSNLNWNSGRTGVGPSFLSKASFLRNVMQRYGVTNKPLYNTEFSLFSGASGQNPSSQEIETTKSYFLIHSMASSMADNYKTAIWHEAIGDRNNSLFMPNLDSFPVYNTYLYANHLLAHAVYSQRVTNSEFVIHEFYKAGKKIWVMWTVDNQPHTFSFSSLPETIEVIGPDGNPTPSASTLAVTLDIAPAIIQFTP
jgi:hypothetical protein